MPEAEEKKDTLADNTDVSDLDHDEGQSPGPTKKARFEQHDNAATSHAKKPRTYISRLVVTFEECLNQLGATKMSLTLNWRAWRSLSMNA